MGPTRNEDILHVRTGLVIAMHDLQEAEAHFRSKEGGASFITAAKPQTFSGLGTNSLRSDKKGFLPCKLGPMYWFRKLLLQCQSDAPEKTIVICCGHDNETITRCALLVGSFLILSEDAAPDEVAERFGPLALRFVSFQDDEDTDHGVVNRFTNFDCWNALFLAKSHGWLNFCNRHNDIDEVIDMDEYFHYDNALNGNLHVIVPSKLIAFSCPRALPDQLLPPSGTRTQQQWFDIRGSRFFTPSYFAEVLGDFDVKLVVSSSRDTDYDEDDFTSAGIALEEIAVSYDSPHHLLHRTDRFLTLAHLAPGAIAIHGDGAGLGAGELLVCAYLIKHHGFEAGQAVAWVRILHPGAPVPAIHFTLEAEAEPEPRLSLTSLNRRHSSSPSLSSLAPAAVPSKLNGPAVQADPRHTPESPARGSTARAPPTPSAMARSTSSPGAEAAKDAGVKPVGVGGCKSPVTARAGMLAQQSMQHLPNVLDCPATNDSDAPGDGGPPCSSERAAADSAHRPLATQADAGGVPPLTTQLGGARMQRSSSFVMRGLHSLLGIDPVT